MHLFAASVLFVICAGVFAPTLGHSFVWDDLEQVRDNEFIRHGSSFWEFWKKDILELSRKGGHFHSNYYRPLFYVQYLIYYQLFGLSTVCWHAMAIAQHALASFAAYFLARRLGLASAAAMAVGVLFVVHPAHGESVSWVAAAFNDPPAASCLMFGLAAQVRRIKTGAWTGLALGLLGYAGALCLKESGLAMLLLVPLVDWFVAPGRPWGHRLRDYAPYVGLTAVYFLVRLASLGSLFGHYEGTTPLAELLPTFPLLAVFYLRLMLWPWHLYPSYPLRYVPDWGDVQAWGSLLGFVAAAIGLLLATRRERTPRFCMFWAACCVWPVFNIRSFLPTYLAHQRYLYLAVFGLCFAMVWLAQRYLRRASIRYAVLAAVVVVWSASNVVHNRAWATDEALWTTICRVDPRNPAGFDWLGGFHLEEGRRLQKEGQSAEARAAFLRAEESYRGAIAADPNSPLGYRNIASLMHLTFKRPVDSIPLYEEALRVFERRRERYQAEEADCLVNYGVALSEAGRIDDAIRAFLLAASSWPYPTNAATNGALLLLQSRRSAEAEALLLDTLRRREEYQQSARLPPEPADLELLRRIVDFYTMTNQPRQRAAYQARLSGLQGG